MRSKLFATTTLAVALLASAVLPTFAADGKPATAQTVKIGYFNLALVKASYPESAGSESLKNQAEGQLRRDVEFGNKKLQEAQEAKKPKEEIEKMAKEMQTEINAKTQALATLVQTQNAIASQNIAQAVNAVAKEKGLDIIVDANSVYSGGDKLLNGGEDITDAIVKRLNPAKTAAKDAGAK